MGKDKEINGPAGVTELHRDEWCIDCGHHTSVHIEGKCNYWTGDCECEAFVSRSEALTVVKNAKIDFHSSVQRSDGVVQLSHTDEKWMLVERYCMRYPDKWLLVFKRNETVLEIEVSEEAWRAFEGIKVG